MDTSTYLRVTGRATIAVFRHFFLRCGGSLLLCLRITVFQTLVLVTQLLKLGLFLLGQGRGRIALQLVEELDNVRHLSKHKMESIAAKSATASALQDRRPKCDSV